MLILIKLSETVKGLEESLVIIYTRHIKKIGRGVLKKCEMKLKSILNNITKNTTAVKV
jgi:hypothetical protein